MILLHTSRSLPLVTEHNQVRLLAAYAPTLTQMQGCRIRLLGLFPLDTLTRLSINLDERAAARRPPNVSTHDRPSFSTFLRFFLWCPCFLLNHYLIACLRNTLGRRRSAQVSSLRRNRRRPKGERLYGITASSPTPDAFRPPLCARRKDRSLLPTRLTERSRRSPRSKAKRVRTTAQGMPRLFARAILRRLDVPFIQNDAGGLGQRSVSLWIGHWTVGESGGTGPVELTVRFVPCWIP